MKQFAKQIGEFILIRMIGGLAIVAAIGTMALSMSLNLNLF